MAPMQPAEPSAQQTTTRQAAQKAQAQQQAYQCRVCNYVYQPSLGDSTQHVAPNTSFGQLPADWHCPECNVSKQMFDLKN